VLDIAADMHLKRLLVFRFYASKQHNYADRIVKIVLEVKSNLSNDLSWMCWPTAGRLRA